MRALPLRAALTRGALLVLANWPVVLIDFAAGSLHRLAVSVPVFGGSIVVASLVGADFQSVLGEGVRSTADLVVGSLATAPIALAAFLLAVGLVAIGGEAIRFIVVMGTFSVIVAADRIAGDVHRMPFGSEAMARVSVFRLDTVLNGARRFGRRAVTMALWLGAGYAALGLAYVAVVTGWLRPGTWLPGWPLLVLVVTLIGLVSITVVNLAFDLLRVIVVTDDCPVPVAVVRLRRFVTEDARQVVGIFAVMGAVQLLAALASLLAAGGLAVVAYVPLLSLVFVPLQAAAWVLRGVLFESLALAALAACQTQYQRLNQPS